MEVLNSYSSVAFFIQRSSTSSLKFMANRPGRFSFSTGFFVSDFLGVVYRFFCERFSWSCMAFLYSLEALKDFVYSYDRFPFLKVFTITYILNETNKNYIFKSESKVKYV